MAEQSARDLKLVQYLNEAYGKEKELETALQAHIGMTTKPAYKKRLQQHLKETKGHARAVERRIKQLGGKAEIVPAPGPVAEAASAVTAVASKAVAAAQGPIHALRGTGENERMLKNARTEYSRTPGPKTRTRQRRSPATPRSRRSPTPSVTRRPPSSPAASAVRRSAWPSSSTARSPS
jgi:hypothetical protein